ncbi:hypothetical protein ACJX0J_020025, partial [Zea mays]
FSKPNKGEKLKTNCIWILITFDLWWLIHAVLAWGISKFGAPLCLIYEVLIHTPYNKFEYNKLLPNVPKHTLSGFQCLKSEFSVFTHFGDEFGIVLHRDWSKRSKDLGVHQKL